MRTPPRPPPRPVRSHPRRLRRRLPPRRSGDAPPLGTPLHPSTSSRPHRCWRPSRHRPPQRYAGRTGTHVVTYTRRPDSRRLRVLRLRDWHSAVNSTWAMVRMAKEMPELPVAALIREKLGFHITARSMQGELEYLAANPTFERPYGWVWLLLLHAELASWDDPQAEAWAEHMEPAADLIAQRLEQYLQGCAGRCVPVSPKHRVHGVDGSPRDGHVSASRAGEGPQGHRRPLLCRRRRLRRGG